MTQVTDHKKREVEGTEAAKATQGEPSPPAKKEVKKRATRKKVAKKKAAKKKVVEKRSAPKKKAVRKKRVVAARASAAPETAAVSDPAEQHITAAGQSAAEFDIKKEISGQEEPLMSEKTGDSQSNDQLKEKLKEMGVMSSDSQQASQEQTATPGNKLGKDGFWPKLTLGVVVLVVGFIYIKSLAEKNPPVADLTVQKAATVAAPEQAGEQTVAKSGVVATSGPQTTEEAATSGANKDEAAPSATGESETTASAQPATEGAETSATITQSTTTNEVAATADISKQQTEAVAVAENTPKEQEQEKVEVATPAVADDAAKEPEKTDSLAETGTGDAGKANTEESKPDLSGIPALASSDTSDISEPTDQGVDVHAAPYSQEHAAETSGVGHSNIEMRAGMGSWTSMAPRFQARPYSYYPPYPYPRSYVPAPYAYGYYPYYQPYGLAPAPTPHH